MSYLALFDDTEFISHAGLNLGWKIEMDALYTDDWRCLAKMIMEYETRPFREAVGIPRGGVRLGQMLNEYATGNPEDPILIVDDVYTTGTSIREFIEENYKDENLFCWVVFARNRIYKRHIKALFQMPSKFRPEK